MLRQRFVVTVGVIILIAIAGGIPFSSVSAQDYRSLSRVQMDDWCTKYAPDHDNPPKRGIQLDSSQQNVYGWGCLDYNNNLHGISISDMCRFYYGDYFADAEYLDYNNPDSWYCNHTGAPAPQPQQPQQPSDQPGGGQESGGSGQQPQPQSQPSGNTSSDARYPDVQDPSGPGVLVPIWCLDVYGVPSTIVPVNAWGWYCNNGVQVDFQEACRDAWGSAYPYATLADWQDIYGWRCSSQPGYVDPMPSGGQQPTEAEGCDLAPSSQLSVGMSVRVSTDELNLRSSPELGPNIIEKYYTGATFQVVGGPECGDGYRWWQVKQFVTGWMADGESGEYYLEPVTDGQQSQQWCTHLVHSAFNTAEAPWSDLTPLYIWIPKGAWDGNHDHIRIYFKSQRVNGVKYFGQQIVDLISATEDGDYIRFGVLTRWAIAHPDWIFDNNWSMQATC